MSLNLIRSQENPGEITEEWRISDEEVRSNIVRASMTNDEYIDAIKNGEINLVRGEAIEYCENGVKLADGQVVEADFIVSATGYFANFDFLGEKLRQILKYDPNNKQLPVILYRSCLHPSLPGLAFIGNIYAIFTSYSELTAEIGVKWIKGLLNLSEEELWEGLRLEEKLRPEISEFIWSYNAVGILKELLRILRVDIDYEMLASLEYTKGPLSAAFLLTDREGRYERILEIVKEIKELVPNFTYI